MWLAAGGGMGQFDSRGCARIGAIGVGYSFYDTSGNNLSLDTTGSVTGSSNFVGFSLYANQPAEIELRGATSNAPGYGNTATGSVYAAFFCPDAATCSNVLPQLIYSALPTYPWSLSVPIAWDDAVSHQWSAEGIDDGGARRVSLVIYNETKTATTYTVRVYDSAGTLVGTGTTPSIPGFPTLSDGSLGDGGTYGALLSEVVKTPLPSGIFKIIVDGGTISCAVEVLQVSGPSATTLQVAYDTTPAATATARTAEASAIRRLRVESTARRVFSEVPK